MSEISKISERDVTFFRRLNRNMVFGEIIGYYAQKAERNEITKRQIARCLRKDAGQISRWLSEPSNLTLDSISDLLLAMDAEMEFKVVDACAAQSTDELMAEFSDWFPASHMTKKVVSFAAMSSQASSTNSASISHIESSNGQQAVG